MHSTSWPVAHPPPATPPPAHDHPCAVRDVSAGGTPHGGGRGHGPGRSRRRRSARATFGSVLGELLLTAGLLVLLFVSWQMWVGDFIISAQRNDEGAATSQAWAQGPSPERPPLVDTGDGHTAYQVPVPAAPADGELFGQTRIGDAIVIEHPTGGTPTGSGTSST